jgi:hypothetical protein
LYRTFTGQNVLYFSVAGARSEERSEYPDHVCTT